MSVCTSNPYKANNRAATSKNYLPVDYARSKAIFWINLKMMLEACGAILRRVGVTFFDYFTKGFFQGWRSNGMVCLCAVFVPVPAARCCFIFLHSIKLDVSFSCRKVLAKLSRETDSFCSCSRLDSQIPSCELNTSGWLQISSASRGILTNGCMFWN